MALKLKEVASWDISCVTSAETHMSTEHDTCHICLSAGSIQDILNTVESIMSWRSIFAETTCLVKMKAAF
ncbi:hypothetical protein ACET3Z_029694 [Daucus carota]